MPLDANAGPNMREKLARLSGIRPHEVLMEAVLSGDEFQVALLLDEGADPNGFEYVWFHDDNRGLPKALTTDSMVASSMIDKSYWINVTDAAIQVPYPNPTILHILLKAGGAPTSMTFVEQAVENIERLSYELQQNPYRGRTKEWVDAQRVIAVMNAHGADWSFMMPPIELTVPYNFVKVRNGAEEARTIIERAQGYAIDVEETVTLGVRPEDRKPGGQKPSM